jgi:RHS repeat-associated protein
LVSRIDAGGNAQYYHYDSRGSTIAMTDASGKITEAYAYDPFGRPINGQLSDNRFRYLGRHGVMDEENGLLYIRARYYSTKRGRFITKDPTTGKDGDSQSLNRYIYALNNPVRLIDISGLSAQDPGKLLNLLSSSDLSYLHNLLLGMSSDDATKRVVSFGDLVASLGGLDKTLAYLGASAGQSKAIGVLGDVSSSINFASGVMDELGGWNNLVQSYQNAGSNIGWLFNGATYSDWLNFGTSVSTKTTAISLNALLTYTPGLKTVYGIASDAYTTATGNDLSFTGNGVQGAIQGVGDYFGGLLYNAAPNWFQ